MNTSHRELQICLLLGGIGLLISFLLPQTQLISKYGWGILSLIVFLASIGFLIAGLLIILRERPKSRNFLIRMSSLAVGLLFLSLVSLMPPENSQKELLSMPILMWFSFFPLGLMLSAFGLFMDVWLSRLLGVNQWKIYRYVVRLVCISMALAPILALIVVNPVRDLGRDFKIIRPVLPFTTLSILLFNVSKKYMRDR